MFLGYQAIPVWDQVGPRVFPGGIVSVHYQKMQMMQTNKQGAMVKGKLLDLLSMRTFPTQGASTLNT